MTMQTFVEDMRQRMLAAADAQHEQLVREINALFGVPDNADLGGVPQERAVLPDDGVSD